MLVAHQIIDVLRGRLKHGKRVDLPGITKEMMHSTADLIEQSEKFDFGTILLEPDDQDRPGHWNIPALTPAEREMWIAGLIPLPHRACWYEWTLGGSRSGILVVEADDGWRWNCQRLDWTAGGLLFEGITAAVDRSRYEDDQINIFIGGNVTLYRMWRQYEGKANIQAVLENNVMTAPMLAMYLTLMLSSRTTEIVDAPAPPERLNRKRMKQGRAPLAPHRIVTIVPERFRAPADPDAPKGTHRSPRLHWRRSHVRHHDHHTPESRWMPEVVHQGKAGWWCQVIPRFLVGRRELGEVSHEYRVQEAPPPAKHLDTAQGPAVLSSAAVNEPHQPRERP